MTQFLLLFVCVCVQLKIRNQYFPSEKISFFLIGINNIGCWFSDINLNSRLQGKGASS